jgi:secernin
VLALSSVCDTVVVVPEEGPVWFAKNSDREPTEAQYLEYHDAATAQLAAPGELPDLPARFGALLSRPGWMWGCEMGVNDRALAIGNEAVFTRVPVPRQGLSGMDFQRLALHGCGSAADALELLVELTERYEQGGAMGHRHRSFRYHSSFIVADPSCAWIFETAGRYWAAKRVRGVATLSNVLSIRDDYDRIHPGAADFARKRGWLSKRRPLDFSAAFSHPLLLPFTGGSVRSACTKRSLTGVGAPSIRDFIATLSDHGDTVPRRGWRSEAPCAHASWLPSRTAAQTTGSLVAQLRPGGTRVWATGTSSPCLSAFKPAPLDARLFPARSVADVSYDSKELWWRHERLHRACLPDYFARRDRFEAERQRFQERCLEPGASAEALWARHADLATQWFEGLAGLGPSSPGLYRAYWSRQSKHNGLPSS